MMKKSYKQPLTRLIEDLELEGALLVLSSGNTDAMNACGGSWDSDDEYDS